MFKKGDILSITFRNGYDKDGKPVMETLERAEVLGCDNGLLQVSYRNLEDPGDGVELDRLVFNIKMSDVLMAQCSA